MGPPEGNLLADAISTTRDVSRILTVADGGEELWRVCSSQVRRMGWAEWPPSSSSGRVTKSFCTPATSGGDRKRCPPSPERRRLSSAILTSIAQTRSVADQVNRLGSFDGVIHNAAVGYQEPRRIATEDGLPHVFAVNTLAPYILTALIRRPRHLVYLSSGLHQRGDASLKDLAWEHRPWQGQQAYSDTKLHDVLLAFAVARRWPDVLSNALEPGWVPTKMGGPQAPDDLDAGHRTQVWLAASDDPAAMVTGEYFYHLRLRRPNPASRDMEQQEKLLDACKSFSGVDLPHGHLETK